MVLFVHFVDYDWWSDVVHVWLPAIIALVSTLLSPRRRGSCVAHSLDSPPIFHRQPASISQNMRNEVYCPSRWLRTCYVGITFRLYEFRRIIEVVLNALYETTWSLIIFKSGMWFNSVDFIKEKNRGIDERPLWFSFMVTIIWNIFRKYRSKWIALLLYGMNQFCDLDCQARNCLKTSRWEHFYFSLLRRITFDTFSLGNFQNLLVKIAFK